MTDWKMMARALGWDLSEAELDRVAAPLEALELAFDRLAATVTPGMDPAVVFVAAPGEDE